MRVLLAALAGTFALIMIGGCGGSDAGSTPPFDTALLTGGGEVGTIRLWDKITDDCQREGVQGVCPAER